MEGGSPFLFVSSLFKDPALVSRWRLPMRALESHRKTTWNVNDNFWVKNTRQGLAFAAIAAGTMRQNLRYTEHVTPAFSVRDSQAVLTVGVGLARQIGYVGPASAMPRAGLSFAATRCL